MRVLFWRRGVWLVAAVVTLGGLLLLGGCSTPARGASARLGGGSGGLASSSNNAGSDVAAELLDATRRFDDREQRQALVAEISAAQQLPQDWVQTQLSQARFVPRVRELIKPAPPPQRNWRAYLARFTEPGRVNGGVAFVREQRAWFELAERRWGVPAPVIAAIIGVETFYGRVQGNYPVLDALATLSLSYPLGADAGRDRSPFFRSELAAYLRWLWNEPGTDARSVRGSYAGAIGMSQFMPSNLLKLAVDLNADQHVDLRQSQSDAIGSVACYLAHWGWRRGATLYLNVWLSSDADLERLSREDLKPNLSLVEATRLGAVPQPPAYADLANFSLLGNTATTTNVTNATNITNTANTTTPSSEFNATTAASTSPNSSEPLSFPNTQACTPRPVVLETEGLYTLVSLPNAESAPDYVLGGHNLYVISRYNHSAFYAMAVSRLAEAIAQQLQQSP